MELVARRFKALYAPARLAILDELKDGEANVGEIVERTGQSQAAVSKQIAILNDLGFVSRRRGGVFVHHALADDEVLELCDSMCGRIEEEFQARGRALAAAPVAADPSAGAE
jgi:DNA-binding transcriptional ArsR family regulator